MFHNVSLRCIKVYTTRRRAYPTILRLWYEIRDRISNGELYNEIRIVGEFIHFGRHAYFILTSVSGGGGGGCVRSLGSVVGRVQ